MPAISISVRPASRASGATTTKLIVMPAPIDTVPSAIIIFWNRVSGNRGVSESIYSATRRLCLPLNFPRTGQG